MTDIIAPWIIAPGPEALPAWVDDTINLASPRLGTEAVAVMPIPHRGLGHAINDRLRKAAARPAWTEESPVGCSSARSNARKASSWRPSLLSLMPSS